MIKVESIDVSYDGQETLVELIQYLVKLNERYPNAVIFNEGYLTLDPKEDSHD